jgi:hypothetical protein
MASDVNGLQKMTCKGAARAAILWSLILPPVRWPRRCINCRKSCLIDSSRVSEATFRQKRLGEILGSG